MKEGKGIERPTYFDAAVATAGKLKLQKVQPIEAAHSTTQEINDASVAALANSIVDETRQEKKVSIFTSVGRQLGLLPNPHNYSGEQKKKYTSKHR